MLVIKTIAFLGRDFEIDVFNLYQMQVGFILNFISNCVRHSLQHVAANVKLASSISCVPISY